MKTPSSADSAAAQISSSAASGLPKAMFIRRVSLNRATSWGTSATAPRSEAARMVLRSQPSRLTVPACGSNSLSARRTAVVLPAPEGPTRAMVWPGGARKLTSLRPSVRAEWR